MQVLLSMCLLSTEDSKCNIKISKCFIFNVHLLSTEDSESDKSYCQCDVFDTKVSKVLSLTCLLSTEDGNVTKIKVKDFVFFRR